MGNKTEAYKKKHILKERGRLIKRKRLTKDWDGQKTRDGRINERWTNKKKKTDKHVKFAI